MGQTRLAENTRKWAAMKIKPSFWPAAQKFAKRAFAHKAQYEDLVAEIWVRHKLRVPWWAVPLVHERECTRGVDNFDCNIAQGCRYSIHCNIIPHSGPFHSWKEAAIDALVAQAPQLAKWTNWSGGGVLTIDESYNGLGYWRMGVTNPYLFSGTDQYIKGKYVADGKYKANVIDTQLGVAISLKALMELDPTITLDEQVHGQAFAPQGIEKTAGASLPTTALAFINTNPWFIFTWWDITGIVIGTVIATGLTIAAVKWWRRRYDK